MTAPALPPLLKRLAALPAEERDALIAALPAPQARQLLRCLQAGAPGAWAGALRAAAPAPSSEAASAEVRALGGLDLSRLPPAAAATLLAGLEAEERAWLASRLSPEARALADRLGAGERAALGQALRTHIGNDAGWPLAAAPAAPAAPARRTLGWRPRWLSA